MKGVSGIIGGVIVILLLLLALSLTLAVLNYAYGVQQIETKTFMSQLSQPHVTQISPNSVMASGRLMASYVIYPSGHVALLNKTVNGIRDFQSILNGSPWAVVVFSNGQWVNISNAQGYIYGSGILGTGSYLVPYYPHRIDPSDPIQIGWLLGNGTQYNTPILHNFFGESYVTYGFGRILAVPVTSESGWLNFSVYWPSSFAILVTNATGTIVAIYFSNPEPDNYNYGIYEYVYYPSLLDASTQVYEYIGSGIHLINPNITYSFEGYYNPFPPQLVIIRSNYGIGIRFIIVDNYTFMNLIRVAVKFSEGRPAQMYLWAAYSNNGKVVWVKVLLPSIANSSGRVVNEGWPVNIYSVVVGSRSIWQYNQWTTQYYPIYEPLTPLLGSAIEVVPYTPNYYTTTPTLIFNVSYSI